MIQKLKSMKANKKGFTLAELLIVVAIIAVLAAIAIPAFTAQLDKARESVDQANLRAATSMAVADYLQNSETNKGFNVSYDVYVSSSATASTESIVVQDATNTSVPTGYEKLTEGEHKSHATGLTITIGEGGEIVKSEWNAKATT